MTVSKTCPFTLNNYTDDDITWFREWTEYSYLVFGLEVAPTTGTPHLQGYFTLKDAVRPSYLKRVLPQKTHFEVARKNMLANTRYCSKLGNYTVIDHRYSRDRLQHYVTNSQGESQLISSGSSSTLEQIKQRRRKTLISIKDILYNKKNATS